MIANKPLLEQRIDKWLWVARFFKTRGLAADAINGGKIAVNGHKTKPAKLIRVADEVRIQRGIFEYTVTVKGLTQQRGSATIAAQLYQETLASQTKREQIHAQLKAENAFGFPQVRPTKRERRQIIKFIRKRESE